jgi:hypothetical protein
MNILFTSLLPEKKTCGNDQQTTKNLEEKSIKVSPLKLPPPKSAMISDGVSASLLPMANMKPRF